MQSTVVAFSTLVACTIFSASTAQEWVRLPGYAMQISAKNDTLWAVTFGKQALRWVDGRWTHTNGDAQYVAATSDGYSWIIGYLKPGTSQYNPSSNSFENSGNFYSNINCVTGLRCVAASPNGSLWLYDGRTLRQLPGKGVQIAIGDGDEMWMVDANGLIYASDEGEWIAQSDNARYVDVQSPNRIVMVNGDLDAYTWSRTGFIRVEGQKCVQATINYKSIYCLTPTGSIYKLDA